MPSFFVRICYAYPLVQKKIEEGIDITPIISKALREPEASDDRAALPEAEQMMDRFTFSLFRIKADSREECRKTVLDAWKKAFPEYPDAAKIVIASDDGSEQAKLTGTILGNYYGAEPYVEMIAETSEMMPRLKEREALKALRMRSYLFAVDPGCGFTTLVSSFGDYLNRMGVFGDDPGKRTRFAEYVAASATGAGKTAPDDIVSELSDDPQNTDLGVVGIDIGYFLEGGKTDELRRFARRLGDIQNDYVFAFRIPFLEKKAMDDVADTLSDVMLLRTVQIPPLHDCVLAETFWDETRRMGYKPSVAALEVFFGMIRREKRDGRFYGFKTAEKTVYDLVLRKARRDALAEEPSENGADTTITPADVLTPEELAGDDKKEKSAYDELGELIGMEKIAARVREIVAQVKMSMKDERLDRPCIHMRFLGAPGTGKTTVARIIGKIFREEGILRKGAFMEYSARMLCAEYVGQTAVKTAAICRDAYGSVLFIDEAYALYQDDSFSNDYGREALTTLISEMENHRDDMLVIMAGYTDDMETLMKGNAGLRSRMPFAVEFESYTKDQLFEIFMLMVRKHFDFTPELEDEAKKYFTGLSDEYISSREFANARFVRNLYERAWSKGALRSSLAGLEKIVLSAEDFKAAVSEKEFSEKLEQTVTVGF